MALVDQFGREIKQNKPITQEIAVQGVRDRYSSYPSHGLTPGSLAAILKEADQGNVYRQSELFEEMEEKDCHLGSVLGTRKLAVAGLDWEILSASDSAEDKKIADAAREMIDYIENWDDALLDTLDAVSKGFAGQEIMWEISEGQVWIKEIKHIHQKRFTFSAPDKLLEIPRLLTDAEPAYGEELLLNKFIIHKHRARSGATARGGLSRPCTYMYLFKNFDIKHWLIFNELFSVPMRIGKYQAGAQKEDIEKLKTAVFNLGVDAAAVISDSTIIELLESKMKGNSSTFLDLIGFCEKSMSKVVLGHTGSADSTPGKLGSEDMAREVRQDLLESDAKSLMKTLKFQVLTPWVGFNFGPGKGIPKIKLHYEGEDDLEKTAKVYGTLVKDAGFQGIGEDHIYEKFSIPRPKEGEPRLGVLVPENSPAEASSKGRTGDLLTNKILINRQGKDAQDSAESEEQEAIDTLEDSFTPKQLQTQMEGVLKPIIEMINASSGYEEVMENLIATFPDMKTDAVGQMLERAIFVSEAWGQLNGSA